MFNRRQKWGIALALCAGLVCGAAWECCSRDVRVADSKPAVVKCETRRLCDVSAEHISLFEESLFREANAARLVEKKPPLQYDESKAEGTREAAGVIASYKTAFHPNLISTAELCAMGNVSPQAVVALWLSSEEHKNILCGDYETAATGAAVGDDGRLYYILRLWKGTDDEP